MNVLNQGSIESMSMGNKEHELKFYMLLKKLVDGVLIDHHKESWSSIESVKQTIHKLKPNIQLFCSKELFDVVDGFELKLNNIAHIDDILGDIIFINEKLAVLSKQLEEKINV